MPPITRIEEPIEGKHCPHCHELIDHLDWNASQQSWGNAWGTVNMDGDKDEDGSDINDSENSEYEYSCPECEASLSYDFFDEPEETEEEIELENTTPIIKPDSEGDTFTGELDQRFYEKTENNNSFVEFMKKMGYPEADDESTLPELKKLYPAMYKDFQTLYN